MYLMNQWVKTETKTLNGVLVLEAISYSGNLLPSIFKGEVAGVSKQGLRAKSLVSQTLIVFCFVQFG